MKRLITSIIILLYPVFAFAGELNVNLGLNSLYLLILDEAEAAISVSSPNIVSIHRMDTLENDKQQVIIKTLSSGNTDMEVISPNISKKYHLNVSPRKAPSAADFIEIDIPYEDDASQ